MTLDRALLKRAFRLKNPPDWECPTCHKGILRIRKETFVYKELRDSIAAHAHDAWEPEWIEYAYSCVLQCTNDKCKEHVFSVGTGGVGQDYEEDNNGVIEEVIADLFKPRFFEPYLCLIPIPPSCPESVSKPLRDSFRLFFASPNAAANSVRVAIEQLLTELGVKRFEVKNGERRPISLHRRIQLLPAKFVPYQEMLFAVKWLGNAGSHSGDELTADDVFNAYELTSHILDEVYLSKAKRLQALAKKVNRNKGPAK